jgi:hypothetical protein
MELPPDNATDEELGRWLRQVMSDLGASPAYLLTLAREALEYNRHTAGDAFTPPEIMGIHEFTVEQTQALPPWARALIQPGGDLALCQWRDGQRWLRLRSARAQVLAGLDVTEQTKPAPRLRVVGMEYAPHPHEPAEWPGSIELAQHVSDLFSRQPRPGMEEAALETWLTRISAEGGQPLRVYSMTRESPSPWFRPGSRAFPGSSPDDVAIYVSVMWLREPPRLGGDYYLGYNQTTGQVHLHPGLVGE